MKKFSLSIGALIFCMNSYGLEVINNFQGYFSHENWTSVTYGSGPSIENNDPLSLTLKVDEIGLAQYRINVPSQTVFKFDWNFDSSDFNSFSFDIQSNNWYKPENTSAEFLINGPHPMQTGTTGIEGPPPTLVGSSGSFEILVPSGNMLVFQVFPDPFYDYSTSPPEYVYLPNQYAYITISNFSAETIDYFPDSPPAQVPAPLPILGAVVALGWSRKLRRRIRDAQTHEA